MIWEIKNKKKNPIRRLQKYTRITLEKIISNMPLFWGNLLRAKLDKVDYKSAKDSYQKILEILKKHFREVHLEYAITLVNFSEVLKKLGEIINQLKKFIKRYQKLKRKISELIMFLMQALWGKFRGVLKIWDI